MADIIRLTCCLLYTLQAMIRNENTTERLDYEEAREWFVNPTSKMLQNNDKRNVIYLFVSKFVSRIYGIRMINAWLSKKKGSTFFDLMTTLLTLLLFWRTVMRFGTNRGNESKCLRHNGRSTLIVTNTSRKHPSSQTERARRENIVILDGLKQEFNSSMM